ncbi:VRR-NUC domain-containing protein [Paenibacillus cellulosilyticus]|uniref:VRR-NUC domain-containing protein n=1 Tax=Paenibacillus cellulosilyticus TaxID=375489 RepID=A0A2V2YSI7_9BACL|nr:VRR-NUC domain-containing protein [Paenibacillus cellulosilyticus]PWV97890.1 VRR-NUC domain-containing protein [Paenibacillus cellulosilyticus]QKS46939.1 VRR-NUC domain-containing protein [Paenibacillus cellulosilyticus]
MGLTMTFPTNIITYKPYELQNWLEGSRSDCSDEYLKGLMGRDGNYAVTGFVEYIAGKHYESLGYRYTHRFGIFGGNKIGTFPESDEILRQRFGDELFIASRSLYPSFRNIKFELPDLMIFSEDCSYVKFVEVKRARKDHLREPQARGLALLALLLNCDVEVCEVYAEEDAETAKAISWEFA